MKHFYAIALAVALSLTASAADLTSAPSSKSIVGAQLFQLENYERPTLPELPVLDSQFPAPRKAVSSFDMENMDVYMYVDYFKNYSNDKANYDQTYFTVQCEPEYTIAEDGTITLNSWNGYKINPVMKYDKTTGKVTMEMGQVLITSGTVKYLIEGIDPTGQIVSTGTIDLEVYSNCVRYSGSIGVRVFNTSTNAYDGWVFISDYPMWVKSNTEVTYGWKANTQSGTYTARCYSEVSEGNNLLYLSGLSRGGTSNLVAFTVKEGKAVAKDKVAVFSFNNGGTATGDFFLYTDTEDKSEKVINANIGQDLKTCEFDCEEWAAATESGYYFGYCAPAKFTFDYTLPEAFAPAGIEDILSEINAPAEYFNLQGISVVNPQAGQILIKRQGSKVSKVLVR